MKISCPACAAKYSIADEKVQDRLAKIRCRKCGTTIVIDGKVSPPHVYAAEGSAAEHAHAPAPASGDAGAAGEYSVDFGDNDQRTMSLADVIAAYNSGQLTAESFIWAEGMTDWKPLGEVAEIVDALHVAASRPSAPMPSSPPRAAAAPWDAPRQSDAAIARAAVSRPGGGRGHTSDLFGGFESAGSEHDVTTSAPDDGGHAAAGAAATGARNESSVLFSLSALTAAAKPSSSSAASAPSLLSYSSSSSAAGKAKGEDSGLIDLKALTAASKPEHDAPMPVLGAPPLGVAPLGLAPLGSGVEAQALTMPQSKNRTGMVIAVGIVLAAVVLGAMFILRPAPPPPAPPPVAAAPAPTPTPTPTPTEPVTAKPPATGTAAEGETKKPVAAGGKWRPRGGGGKKTVGDEPSSGSGGGDKPAPAAKKPAGNKCGCAPDNLMCNMACSAK